MLLSCRFIVEHDYYVSLICRMLYNFILHILKLSISLSKPAWYPGIQERYNKWVASVEACGVEVTYYDG